MSGNWERKVSAAARMLWGTMDVALFNMGHVLVHGVQNPDSEGLGDGLACLAGLDDVSYLVSLLFVVDVESDHLSDFDVVPVLRIKQGWCCYISQD